MHLMMLAIWYQGHLVNTGWMKLRNSKYGFMGSMQLDQYSGFTAKMFTPDIRKFFDVNTNFVGKKLMKLLLPYKQFEWE